MALPVALAYAQLAGFDPVVGLYSSILPLVAHALFGTSRHLMVNPDAATCAMIAAAVAPLAAHNSELYLSISIALTVVTGVICAAASFLRLGALADFLSRTILVGYLNGIAISIFLGQVGKVLGFSIESNGIVPRLIEIFDKVPQTHGPTLAVGLGSFAVLVGVRRFLLRLPAAQSASIERSTRTACFRPAPGGQGLPAGRPSRPGAAGRGIAVSRPMSLARSAMRYRASGGSAGTMEPTER